MALLFDCYSVHIASIEKKRIHLLLKINKTQVQFVSLRLKLKPVKLLEYF